MITKLKSISVKEIDAHGNEYQDRQGNPQARVAIQIDNPAYDGKWLATFTTPGDFITQWQRNEEIDIQITEKNGFINFKPTKPASKAMADSFRAKAGMDTHVLQSEPQVSLNPVMTGSLPANQAEMMLKLDKIRESLGWFEDYIKRIDQKLEVIIENQNPKIEDIPF